MESGVRVRCFLSWMSALLLGLAIWGNECAAGPEKGAKNRIRVPSPLRESLVEYRNTVSTRSFRKRADLTYNPYYAMELHVVPAYAFGPRVRLTFDLLMKREFTRSDTTTKQGELTVEDVFLKTMLPKAFTIPGVEIRGDPSLRLVVPTSKESKARTLLLGVRPSLLLSRRFKVFNGLTINYLFEVQKNFHDSTTMQTERPVIMSTPGSIRSLESFSNLGERNVSWTLINGLVLKLRFKKVYTALIGMKMIHGFLYPLKTEDDRISHSPMPETQVRYLMVYTGELAYRLYPGIKLVLGFLTKNYQLADNATYEPPFFNRYTALFFDVRVNVPNLTRRLSLRGKK